MPSYVITGANRGLGLEFVNQISARPGTTVFGLVRNKAGSKDLLALESSCQNVRVLEGDITDPESLRKAAAEVAKVTGGTLDVLINNASLVAEPGYPVAEYPDTPDRDVILEKDFIESFRVNAVGTIHATNAFLPLVLKSAQANSGSSPRIISLGSGIAALDFIAATGLDIAAPYTISKAAQAAVVAKYAATYYKENIIFLTISPGMVNTAIAPPTPEQMKNVVKLIQSFQRAIPEWDGNPLTPPESVRYMLNVIDNLKKEDSGKFISHKGNDKDWL